MRGAFGKVLVANRGEIACRIFRTLKELGIGTVAVYSDADAAAMHVRLADEAYRIGPPPAAESYLNIPAILDVARHAGVDAIHPGYGFLSENAEFAEACAAAGIAFIGPPAKAIRAMGGKAEAKALMAKAGVPVVPGYHGADQSSATLAKEAGKIGFPVLIKAAAGGGGKGMKLAESAEEFPAALASAKREAAASFADDTVLLERYLAKARHVEVQVFADSFGTTVHLFERDCSIQRRHQKIVEEAPAPRLSDDLRWKMGDAAVAAARAVHYLGAGTIEFLLAEDGRFYFMEMNTRLQVEHAVTEMVTGFDLVEWQIRVAAGEPLPATRERIVTNGHAIEARIYAENPNDEFRPQTGRLDYVAFPEPNPHVRVDTGFATGDEVSVHYDPLIAKLIVWDTDRQAAVRRLRVALRQARIAGPVTHLPLLRAIAESHAYLAADLDTAFLDRHREELLGHPPSPSPEHVALAALGHLLHRRERLHETRREAPDPHSPWGLGYSWRLNAEAIETVRLRSVETGAELSASVRHVGDGWHIDAGAGEVAVSGELAADGALRAILGAEERLAMWLMREDTITVVDEHGAFRFRRPELSAGAATASDTGDRVVAVMPGRVTALLAEPGAKVTARQPLLVLEAMKMEHVLRAPRDGVLKGFRRAVGDQVAEGEELAMLEPEAE